jgi:hypothetical protein
MENNEPAKTDRKEYFRRYMREWRQRNPEKVKEVQERYWSRRLQRQQLAGESGHTRPQ